jgi:hypothetical protein
LADGAIPRKFKELMALAVGVDWEEVHLLEQQPAARPHRLDHPLDGDPWRRQMMEQPTAMDDVEGDLRQVFGEDVVFARFHVGRIVADDVITADSRVSVTS